MSKNREDDIDGCDVPIKKADATADEDLPVAAGGPEVAIDRWGVLLHEGGERALRSGGAERHECLVAGSGQGRGPQVVGGSQAAGFRRDSGKFPRNYANRRDAFMGSRI